MSQELLDRERAEMNAEMKYKTKGFNFAAYHNLETVSTCADFSKNACITIFIYMISCISNLNKTSKSFYSLQIYSFMDSLIASHPNLISKVKIGSTYENRPMYALKVNRLCHHKHILQTDIYLCIFI